MTSRPPIDTFALEREAVRLCRRYIDEVVLPLDLCPWAAPALQDQRVKIFAFSGLADRFQDAQKQPTEPAVRNQTNNRQQQAAGADVVARAPHARHGEPTDPLAAAARWSAQTLAASAKDPSTDLVLLVYPGFRVSRSDLDGLLRGVRAEEQAAQFVMAAFHPEADLDTTNPDRLVPYLRRSPDPMIQALSKATHDRIDPGRGAGTAFLPLDVFLTGELTGDPPPSPRERVALANLERIRGGASAELARALQAIHEDRLRTYEKLGCPLPP